MNRKYIGIVHWGDMSGVLDNTSEGSFHQVWKELTKAHRIHSGASYIYRAKYDENGNVVGKPIKHFPNVETCKREYLKRFQNNMGV